MLQRDTDRLRAEKRKGKPTLNDKDGLTPAQRKERCAPTAPVARSHGPGLRCLRWPRARAPLLCAPL